jgi:molybdopterin-synthase adenylyltransferase
MERSMSRFDRQSFLGPGSEARLDAATIGIVGLGGGGSHEVQQFAHIGIGGYVAADPDYMEHTNSNRLIGGTLRDVAASRAKYKIARRIIRGLQPHARVIAVRKRWQDATDALKTCDIIMGAVDGFAEREELERFARRHLIPYIDIGMDVHDLDKDGFLISGQVVLSSPGSPCLRCCGVITDERLAAEAEKYGGAGKRPQVVWPNGVLASTAVGLAVQLLTPWYPNPPAFAFLEYDGNRGTVSVSAHVAALKGHVCPHHPPAETGDPFFDIRLHLKAVAERHAPAWRCLWNEVRAGMTRMLKRRPANA